MELGTKKIDPRTFFEENDISLTCGNCGGTGCDDCQDGQLSVIWNTITDTGFRANGPDVSTAYTLSHDFGGVVAFRYEGNIWFGLSGCGMDMSPYYCRAWIELFPGVDWLPDNWINTVNLYGGYYRSLIGEAGEKKVLDLYGKSLESEYQTAKRHRLQLKEFLKNRRAKAKKCRKP